MDTASTARGTSFSMVRLRLTKTSSMTGLTSQAMAPPSTPAASAHMAPAATARQCDWTYGARRRRTRYRGVMVVQREGSPIDLARDGQPLQVSGRQLRAVTPRGIID